jgi:hypothetical protein
MGYWKAAAGRAWREAWASHPWSSPVKAICAILAVGIPTWVAWATTGEFVWGGLVALVGVFLIGLFLFAHQLSAVPPAMHAEADGEISRLKLEVASWKKFSQPATPPEPDTVIDQVSRTIDPAICDLPAVLGAIRQAAYDKKIGVWGRKGSMEGVSQQIWHGFWEDMGIDAATRAAGRLRTEKKDAQTNAAYRYWDLRVNRAEVDKAWPPVAD